MGSYVVVLMGDEIGITVRTTQFADNVSRTLENYADYISGATVVDDEGYALLHFGERSLSAWNKRVAEQRVGSADPLSAIYG